MDYKEKVIALLNSKELSQEQKEKLESIFSELKESEDEKTKRILHSISSKISFHLCDIFTEEEFQCFDAWSNAWLEKQGEPKLTGKFEPKFKVGDWIVRGKTIAQILDIQEQYYVGLDIDGNDFTSSRFLSNDKIHLWTIQDAKSGDILVIKENKNPFIFKGLLDIIHPESPVAYCGIDMQNKFFVCSSNAWWTYEEVEPATEEQRELLFAKMKEAGYEWNTDKKELKKI